MRLHPTSRSAPFAALATALLAGHASADVIISNLPGNDGTQSASLQGGRIKAMGFTMPLGDDYELQSIELRLNISSLGVVPVIRIFSDAGGQPGNELATLDNPAIGSTGIATHEFTPPSTFVLEQGASYWVVVWNSGATSLSWMANSPAVTPTGLATHYGSLFASSGAPSPPIASNTSAILNSYAVNGIPATSGCYANCDSSTTPPVLNVDDFTCFINEFAAAQSLPHEQQETHYSNCDGSTTAPALNVDDFTCFINAFAQGCP